MWIRSIQAGGGHNRLERENNKKTGKRTDPASRFHFEYSQGVRRSRREIILSWSIPCLSLLPKNTWRQPPAREPARWVAKGFREQSSARHPWFPRTGWPDPLAPL